MIKPMILPKQAQRKPPNTAKLSRRHSDKDLLGHTRHSMKTSSIPSKKNPKARASLYTGLLRQKTVSFEGKTGSLFKRCNSLPFNCLETPTFHRGKFDLLQKRTPC